MESFRESNSPDPAISEIKQIASNHKGLIVFFLPECFNVGSIAEARSFSDNYSNFLTLGWEIVCVTSCPQNIVDEFQSELNLGFKIYSDTNLNISSEFSVTGNALYGVGNRFSPKAKRTTLVLSNEIEILHQFNDIIPIEHARTVFDYLVEAFEPLELSRKSHGIA